MLATSSGSSKSVGWRNDLSVGRVEQRLAVVGVRGGDVARLDDPQADALRSACEQVAGVLERQFGVGSVHGAGMDMADAALGARRTLPRVASRPCRRSCCRLLVARAACFSAYAVAASRTQVPPSWAATRVVHPTRGCTGRCP